MYSIFLLAVYFVVVFDYLLVQVVSRTEFFVSNLSKARDAFPSVDFRVTMYGTVSVGSKDKNSQTERNAESFLITGDSWWLPQ